MMGESRTDVHYFWRNFQEAVHEMVFVFLPIILTVALFGAIGALAVLGLRALFT
jgi:hypothetical protein